MVHNQLFRQCLAAIPEEQKAEFELSFGIAERISEILKMRISPKKTLPISSTSESLKSRNG